MIEKMKRIIIIIIILCPLSLAAQILKGRVVKIADGDTFTLLVNEQEQIKIRLDGIDAPEKGQAYGNRAKEYLSSMISGVLVTVEIKSIDRYGRSIGKVSTSTIADVNIEMIKAGYAWQYREYNNDKTYTSAENQARKNKRGLWQDKNPIRPQDYRKNKRKK